MKNVGSSVLHPRWGEDGAPTAHLPDPLLTEQWHTTAEQWHTAAEQWHTAAELWHPTAEQWHTTGALSFRGMRVKVVFHGGCRRTV